MGTMVSDSSRAAKDPPLLCPTSGLTAQQAQAMGCETGNTERGCTGFSEQVKVPLSFTYTSVFNQT